MAPQPRNEARMSEKGEKTQAVLTRTGSTSRERCQTLMAVIIVARSDADGGNDIVALCDASQGGGVGRPTRQTSVRELSNDKGKQCCTEDKMLETAARSHICGMYAGSQR